MNCKEVSGFALFLLLSFSCLFAQSTLQLTANFETIGITVLLDTDDPEMDAYGELEYKLGSSSQWITGFPLSRMDNDLSLCSGSIFWLEDNVSYDVRIRIIDPTTSTLDGQILVGSIATKKEPSSSSINGTVYNVDPEGSGSNFTLQEAINLAVEGDLVLLQKGTYFVGNITFPHNGTNGNPIQVKGVDRNTVVLDGAHELPLIWSPVGTGGMYQTTTDEINPNLVIADGVRLYPHQTYPDLIGNKITMNYFPLREYSTGIPGFYRNPTLLPFINFGDPAGITKNKLYVKFLDGSDPNEKDIHVTKQANCFKFDNNSFISMSNLTFRNFGLGSVATAVILEDSHNVHIDSCNFLGNNSSILLLGNTADILIENTSFEDYMFDWNAWKIKSTQDFDAPFNDRFPNLSRNLEKGSMLFGHSFTGNNIVFRDNIIENYHQGGAITPAPPNASEMDILRKSLDIDFYRNRIINCRGDGFEIDGIARNIRVFDNSFIGCHAPLSMAAASEGPVYILRNTFSNIIPDYYDNGFELVQTKGHPLKFQVGGNKINGDIYFYHNTIDAKNVAYGMNVYQVTTANAWKKLDSKNNIFIADDGLPLNVNTISGKPNFLSDYNNYYTQDGNVFCVKYDISGMDCSESLSDLFINHNWDEHSIQEDPLFVDAVDGNYQLLEDSPVIDKGTIIQGINETAYVGLAPDIGAFEYKDISSSQEFQDITFTAFPNPVLDYLHITCLSCQQNLHMTILDIHGREIASYTMDKNDSIINVKNLFPGIYFLQLSHAKGLSSMKFIKI